MPKPIVLRFHVKDLPKGVRLTKFIIAGASMLTILSMIALTIVSLLTSDASFRKSHGLEDAASVVVEDTATTELVSTDEADTTEANIAETTVESKVPVVTLTASKQTAEVNDEVDLTWSATEQPSQCDASDDWGGSQKDTGSLTIKLDKVQSYIFTLTCSTSTGTGFAVASVTVGDAPKIIQQSTTNQTSGTGNTVTRPKVTLSVNPTAVKVGSSATLTWKATNSPTSCTASGAWSGTKASSGSQSTGALKTAGLKTYTLSCTNRGGSEKASVVVTVTKSAPPVVSPAITLSVSPASLSAGSAATVSWSVANSPTSCTASGAWSGSKGSSGSQSTGSKNAGTYTYVLTCSNKGGTTSKSASLTVKAAPVYCGGKTPCYGKSTLASHTAASSCWAWSGDWVLDITSYQSHHKDRDGASSSQLAKSSSVCNHSVKGFLDGTAAIPGYTFSGKSKHTHRSSTRNNTSSSKLAAYRVGYYDASKP